MLDRIFDVAERLGPWGYLLFFGIVLLECQPLAGLFMPGESLVLLGGFLAGHGVFDPVALAAVVGLAAILGDSLGYELGRRLGLPWLLRHGRRLGARQEHLDRVEAFVGRHGGKAVFAGHFTHMMRALMPFVAGASRMPYRRFLAFNAAGCLAWAATFVAIGDLARAGWRVAEKWAGRAGEIVGGALLLALLLEWGWRWLLRHEAVLSRRWRELAESPRVAALRARFAPQLAFLQARFSPEGFLGLQLTIGLLVLVAASWLFGGIAEDVAHGDPLTVVDREVALWLHARSTPGLHAAMRAVTALASPGIVSAIAGAAAVLLAWRRRWDRLLVLALALPGGMALDLMLKTAFHRTRPLFEDPAAIFSGYSFPSGHTMAATLLYGLLAAFAFRSSAPWRWRMRSVAVAAVAIVLVAFSRMYLGAHYLSDVLGAIAAGTAWLALCLTAVGTLRRYRAGR